jgi:hypothetical protein
MQKHNMGWLRLARADGQKKQRAAREEQEA